MNIFNFVTVYHTYRMLLKTSLTLANVWPCGRIVHYTAKIAYPVYIVCYLAFRIHNCHATIKRTTDRF